MMPDLHEFLTIANKTFGENTAVIIGENSSIDVDVISTGVELIDEAIGVGGIPRGRITEIYGKESVGKSTLCLQTIAQAHKQGLDCAYVDAEHALSIDRMRDLGVNTEKLVIVQPDSGEQALDFVEMSVRSGQFAVIVVDSVAALATADEIQKDMGDSSMATLARLMSKAMKKLAAPVSKNNVALIFTNQTRTNIGVYGGGEVTSGGNALKFYASLRLHLRQKGQIKDASGNKIADKVELNVKKNKVAVPFKKVEYQIDRHGINADLGWIEALIDSGKLTKTGSWFKIGDETIAQGVQALMQRLQEEPELRKRLKSA